MNTGTLFISDLHLRGTRRSITRRFLQFLETRAMDAEQLYILGDLFDAWVGDDDPSPPNRRVIAALRRLTDAGIPVSLQLGNRDFLIGERFIRETGVSLLEDYAVIDLYGRPTLLMHGDLLCSDDIPYLEFRKKTRAPDWREYVLSKPLLLRLAYARWYRFRSFFHKRGKTGDIMDVNQQTVIQTMQQYGVNCLIHGHTHRPAVHDLQIAGQPGHRIVLDQWEQRGNVLVCEAGGKRFEYLD